MWIYDQRVRILCDLCYQIAMDIGAVKHALTDTARVCAEMGVLDVG